MLTNLTLHLQKEAGASLGYNSSSLFQGTLMEYVSPEYGAALHQTGLKPYAQYIEAGKETLRWHILTMTKEAGEQIIDKVLKADLSCVHLKHKDLKLPITQKEMKTITYEELLEKEYFGTGSRYAEIKFISPAAFKSKGVYVFHPDIRLIFQSLMNKFDACCDSASIGSEEVLEHLAENIVVSRYNLRSVQFHMEGIRIPSFLGSVTLRINGPQPLVNLAQLLLAFGEYSGVGIKCAIGMGGIARISGEERKKHDREL